MGTVLYSNDGDVQTFDIGVRGLEQIVVDQRKVPEELRPGLARQLLASSCLACYGAVIQAALKRAGIGFSTVRGEAELGFGLNGEGAGRVRKIHLRFEVVLKEEKDRLAFNLSSSLFQDPCFITGSLIDGIEVSHEVKAGLA